jgi:hypothetical protein
VSSCERPEAVGLNDGIVGGYPSHRENEWASGGEKAGAWAKLTWSAPQTVSSIVLFDRPNLADHVLAGVLEFSDGSSTDVGELVNDASRGTVISFPVKSITWVKFTVTKASDQTQNVGLSEILVLKP